MPTRPDLISAPGRSLDLLVRFGARIAQLIHRPIAQCRVTAATQAGNERVVTVQVIDRNARDLDGRWLIALYLTPTAGSAPSATDNTVSVTTGRVWATVTAHAEYLILTDGTGKAVVSVTLAGSGVRARVLGTAVAAMVSESDSIGWT